MLSKITNVSFHGRPDKSITDNYNIDLSASVNLVWNIVLEYSDNSAKVNLKFDPFNIYATLCKWGDNIDSDEKIALRIESKKFQIINILEIIDNKIEPKSMNVSFDQKRIYIF